MIKKVLKKKAPKIAALAILVLFVLYNIVWAAFYFFKVHPYEKAVGYDEQRESYSLRDGDYRYYVGAPNYLSFTFNLSITQVRKVGENGNPDDGYCCDLLIWPKIFGDDEYGIQVSHYSDGNMDFGTQMYLDANMTPLNSMTDEEVEAYEEYEPYVKELYRRAFEMWPDLKDKAEK